MSKTSTQQYLKISEIRDDVVILKDGTLRAVIMASSINFALKSEEEQDAIISAYVSFLNNLEFPLQIVIQSRELDIEGYLKMLKRKEKEQTNELLKMQISEYLEYISELIQIGQIMTKRFYVVVPYNPLSDKAKNFWSRLISLFTPKETIRLRREVFKRRKAALMNRVKNIMSGLNSIGVATTMLDTQALIELYYNAYNPATSKKEKMTKVDKLRVE